MHDAKENKHEAILEAAFAARVMTLGFAGLILLGSALLSLPACRRVALNYVDCLYMAASAVCVTGLGVVDVADTFTPLGRCVMGALIQLGGLGVATIGAGVMLAAGRKVNLRERSIVQSALNLESGKGVVRLHEERVFNDGDH